MRNCLEPGGKQNRTIDDAGKASDRSGRPRGAELTREDLWAEWMRSAISGDARAYRRLLEDVTPYLRSIARRRLSSIENLTDEVEDIVQEVLLALHQKRGSWDQTRSIGPWVSTIARNKIIDVFRRRGHRMSVPIVDLTETLAAPAPPEALEQDDIDFMLSRLEGKQRKVVQMVSIQGISVREAASNLKMTEGAVYVALHRALKNLQSLYKRAFE
jgi:RNA polymerase sigma factor (sigma-70 family)